MKKFESRKFILTVSGITLLTVLLAYGKIDQNVFSQTFMFVFGGYSLSNIFDPDKKQKPSE